MDSELIVALTPLVLAVVGLILQWLKSKDTDKHGDAFITMLKDSADTFNRIATVVPSLQVYADQYKGMIEEADKIWNSGGFTAENVEALKAQYIFWKMQFDAALAKYRAIKTIIREPAPIDEPTTP